MWKLVRHCWRLQMQLIRSENRVGNILCWLMAHTQTSFEFSCRVSPRGMTQGYILSRVNNRTPPARENRHNSNTHTTTWAQSDRTSRHTFWNDKLAITCTDAPLRPPTPSYNDGFFTLPNSELKWMMCHLVTNGFISVLDRWCPAPWGGTLNSCGQFLVGDVCLS